MGSVESHLEVINRTNRDIVSTSVSGTDNYDWHDNSRPDYNFQGIRIPRHGGSVQRRAELNKQASHCPFNMTLNFSDGTVDTFRIHQRHAIGCCAGFNHMRKTHEIDYQRSGNKLVITVKNTYQQLQNEQAEERNQEGQAKMRQKQYEEAIKKFDEALRLANESSTINNIKTNKSEACSQVGKSELEEALKLESDTTQDKSKEAESKFDRAKNFFQQSRDLKNSTEHQKNLDVVNLKIDGNKLFNEGNKLEKEAFELFQKGKNSNAADYTDAQNKYKDALAKYEAAEMKFEEGAKIDNSKFDDSVEVCKQLLQELKKVIDDIDRAELNENIGKVNVDEEKKEKNEDEEIVNKKLQQQVDVATD